MRKNTSKGFWFLLIVLLTFGSSVVFLVQKGRAFAAQYDRNERLWAAAGTGDTLTAQRLLYQGADPNYTADGVHTVLRLAVFSRNPATVQAVLAAGADVQGGPEGGTTPLQEAKAIGDKAIITLLLQAGAKN